MRKMDFEIKGIGPLLMDRYTGAEITPNSTEEVYRKAADAKTYRNSKGELCIPSYMLKACLREAASLVAPRMKQRSAREMVRSLLFIEPGDLSMKKKKYDVMDARPIARHITSKKTTRVLCYRPRINQWKVKGRIVAGEELTPDHIRQLLEVGGLRKGIGAYRPEFGRFKLVKFKIIE